MICWVLCSMLGFQSMMSPFLKEGTTARSLTTSMWHFVRSSVVLTVSLLSVTTEPKCAWHFDCVKLSYTTMLPPSSEAFMSCSGIHTETPEALLCRRPYTPGLPPWSTCGRKENTNGLHVFRTPKTPSWTTRTPWPLMNSWATLPTGPWKRKSRKRSTVQRVCRRWQNRERKSCHEQCRTASSIMRSMTMGSMTCRSTTYPFSWKDLTSFSDILGRGGHPKLAREEFAGGLPRTRSRTMLGVVKSA
mmetsp:Transcript_52974/g.164124  ORF Transcript_52974/g.164124 Transcript_52974/m.164124 type:complete len:246 (+) Transcript_52974:381-1118(+)